MLFLFIEFLPIFEILVEIDLVGSPEGGQVFFIHFIDRVILDGEEDKSLFILGQDGLFLRSSLERGRHFQIII